jgi:hypothetical protein
MSHSLKGPNLAPRPWKPELVSFVVGVVIFSAAELAWLVVRQSVGDPSVWTLESESGIAVAALVILGGMTWHGARRWAEPSRGVAEPVVAYAGICTSLTIWMFVVGAGNLWPIVLFVDYVLVAPPAFVGWVLGRASSRRRTSGCS